MPTAMRERPLQCDAMNLLLMAQMAFGLAAARSNGKQNMWRTITRKMPTYRNNNRLREKKKQIDNKRGKNDDSC